MTFRGLAAGTLSCMLLATDAAAIFRWELGCYGEDGTHYAWHTDFSGVISAFADPETGDDYMVLVACETGAMEQVFGDRLYDLEDLYAEMYFSSLEYSWSEVQQRFRDQGYETQTVAAPANICLCEPKIIERSKWPEWPDPKPTEGE